MSDNEIPDASEISIPSSVEQAPAGRVVVNEDATHNTELRELVGLWRGMAEQNNVPESNATSLEWCADELEALIERYDYE